jgi:hypothetical protein
MPTFPFPESAVIITQAIIGRDGDGNDVYGPAEVPVTGAFAPAGSTELIQGEDVVISNPTFYLDDGSPIPSATDSMRIRGVEYLVDGKPQAFHNPFTGDEPGAVVRLENVT